MGGRSLQRAMLLLEGSRSTGVIGMRKLWIPRAAALLLICVCLVGCGSPSSVATTSTDWVAFEGESVSLDLPSNFKGGSPGDPDTISQLRGLLSAVNNPEERQYLQSTLAGLESGELATDGTQLAMFGTPSADGRMPVVYAARYLWDPTHSLEEYVELKMLGGKVGATVESISDDKAYCVVFIQPVGSEEIFQQHQVFITRGANLYVVLYSFDGESNALLDAVFRASAKTIVVK